MQIKSISLCHRNIRVQIKTLDLSRFILPLRFYRFRLFIIPVADTNALVIHLIVAVKAILICNDFSVVLNRYFTNIGCYHIASFGIFNECFHCFCRTFCKIRCLPESFICFFKPFCTYIGKGLICDTAKVIKELICRFIVLCSISDFIKRKRICNILTSGTTVRIKVHPNNAFLFSVNEKLILIIYFLFSIGITMRDIFVCIGFFCGR